jgi:hypothetical protein
MKEYLSENESFLTKSAEEYINRVGAIGVIVDSDFDTYDKEVTKELEKNEGVRIQLYPTFCLFEKYSTKLEELFAGDSKFSEIEWSLYTEIESFEKEYKEKYLMYTDYQYGGNVLFPTQGEYDNFLGYYFGEYGDAGSVYISVIDKDSFSMVDMF